MARYCIGTTKTGVNTASTVMWAIKAGAADRAFLLELGLWVATAPTTGPDFRLLRPNAAGVTPTSTLFQAEDTGDPVATAALETAWGTAPTLQATPIDLRRFGLPVTAGSGIVWTFGNRGLVIPTATELLIVNGNAAGTTVGSFGIYAVIDE